MSIDSTPSWQWSELDPLTRSVVAAFAWRIGDESLGDISIEDFVNSMTAAFADISGNDVVRAGDWSGAEGMRNIILGKLSGFDAEPVANMTRRLCQLAGGSEAVIALAAQTGQRLMSPSMSEVYETIPALRVLSEMAIAQR